MVFLPCTCFAKITFSSDEISISLPHEISASGNTIFKSNGMTIQSNHFTYDLESFKGSFHESIHVSYLKSSLNADLLLFDTSTEEISGKHNISLKAPNIIAKSDSFYMKENTIITLNDNVFIERNGSQIKSNELIYHLKTDSILSNERVKLKLMVEE